MLLLHPVSAHCVSSLSIGFLLSTSAHCADSFRYGGAAVEAWLQGSADAGWSVCSGIMGGGDMMDVVAVALCRHRGHSGPCFSLSGRQNK